MRQFSGKVILVIAWTFYVVSAAQAQSRFDIGKERTTTLIRKPYVKHTLFDSTEIILNRNSGLTYASDSLAYEFFGEAYFHVFKAAKMPLIVQADSFYIRCDSSAEFMVDSYEIVRQPDRGPHGIYIRVFSGTIEVAMCNSPQRYNLGGDHTYGAFSSGVYTYDAGGQSKDSLWFNGHYYFNVVSVSQLADLAKHLYGVNVKFSLEQADIYFHDVMFDPNSEFIAGIGKALLGKNYFELAQLDEHEYRLDWSKEVLDNAKKRGTNKNTR